MQKKCSALFLAVLLLGSVQDAQAGFRDKLPIEFGANKTTALCGIGALAFVFAFYKLVWPKFRKEDNRWFESLLSSEALESIWSLKVLEHVEVDDKEISGKDLIVGINQGYIVVKFMSNAMLEAVNYRDNQKVYGDQKRALITFGNSFGYYYPSYKGNSNVTPEEVCEELECNVPKINNDDLQLIQKLSQVIMLKKSFYYQGIGMTVEVPEDTELTYENALNNMKSSKNLSVEEMGTVPTPQEILNRTTNN